MSTRQLAIAADNNEIDASQERAIAARAAKPRSALEALASRLQINPENLKRTLMATVFKECRNDSEFAALVVVCNEYRLNPLLKEIYAFPQKGGGIVPMVSVDGWIRIMNEHPAFDGIEFEYINDAKGGTVAIESVIYRKDRGQPTKVIEYMDECKGNTAPWQKSPRRMLRHRALIQGARVAFGFSGIVAEGDEAEFVEISAEQRTLPSRQTLAEDLGDEIPAFDKETGEVIEQSPATGMTEVDEETARDLDAREGRADTDMGEGHAEADELPAWHEAVEAIKAAIDAATTKGELARADTKFVNIRAGLPDEVVASIEQRFTDMKNALAKREGSK